MSAKTEIPQDEMKRLVREIAGKATAGEKEPQLMARAARRLNAGLPGDLQVSDRKLRAYWYAETSDIPSHHMDRARELAFVQPIEEAIHAVETAERFLEGLRQRLMARPGADRRAAGASNSDGQQRRAADSSRADHSNSAVVAKSLTSIVTAV